MKQINPINAFSGLIMTSESAAKFHLEEGIQVQHFESIAWSFHSKWIIFILLIVMVVRSDRALRLQRLIIQ